MSAIKAVADYGRGAARDKRLIGFGVLHSFNTALNMGFTLVQLVVLARILPLDRYTEVVFLASVGLYFQPLDQALGKANFVALRAETVRTGQPRARPELSAALAGQAMLLLVASVAIPSVLATAGHARWGEDVLFLFLCFAINFWAFDLQSTAWSIGCNMPFVKLSIGHRCCHLAALAVAFLTGSFFFYGILASLSTIVCMVALFRIFARAGLFETGGLAADWPDYLRILRVAFLATLSDFLVLNMPYALIAARFGIGPMLLIFDSVMKIARIAMAGSRTLAEIALPRHSELVAKGRPREARRLFSLVMGLSIGATLVPAVIIVVAGPTVFHILLGRNDVIPAGVMPSAALVILASSLYQSAVFFLSYGDQRRPVRMLTGLGAVGMAGFAALLYWVALEPAMLLGLFGLCLMGLGFAATVLTYRLLREDIGVSASDKIAAMAEDPSFASEP